MWCVCSVVSRQMCWPSVTSVDSGGMELFTMLLINVGVPMNFILLQCSCTNELEVFIHFSANCIHGGKEGREL